MIIDFSEITNEPPMIGDCVPMSYDNGKTWCVEYDYIQAHTEFEWKTWFDITTEKLNDSG